MTTQDDTITALTETPGRLWPAIGAGAAVAGAGRKNGGAAWNEQGAGIRLDRTGWTR